VPESVRVAVESLDHLLKTVPASEEKSNEVQNGFDFEPF
jgi:hypothetical protein